jgi:hypothetical protein
VCLKILEVSSSVSNNHFIYEIAKDFASPILAILAILGSILIAFNQSSKHHKSTIKAQEEEVKLKTRIDVFNDINRILDDSKSEITSIYKFSTVRAYTSNISKIYQERKKENYNKEVKSLREKLQTAITKSESHQIVNVKLFQAFINSLESIDYELGGLNLKEIESDKFDSFTEEESEYHEGMRREVLTKLRQASKSAMFYFGDFQICLQNMAYSEIFGSNVPQRNQNEFTPKVISNNDNELQEFLEYLDTETEWGRNRRG